MTEEITSAEIDEDVSVDELGTPELEPGEEIVAAAPVKTEKSTEAVIDKITEEVKSEIGGELAMIRVEARMKEAVRELVEQGLNISAIKEEILSRMRESADRIEAAANRLEAKAKEAEVQAEVTAQVEEHEDTASPEEEASVKKAARAYGLI